MAIIDLFGSGEHMRNLGHFAAIVNLAAVDGDINQQEQAALKRFATKLDISEEEYKRILKNPEAFPIHPNNSFEGRLERLHDLFTIIFSDNEMDEEEAKLVKKYAIGIGFSSATAEDVINRSIRIFEGKINFDDYKYLVCKE